MLHVPAIRIPMLPLLAVGHTALLYDIDDIQTRVVTKQLYTIRVCELLFLRFDGARGRRVQSRPWSRVESCRVESSRSTYGHRHAVVKQGKQVMADDDRIVHSRT